MKRVVTVREIASANHLRYSVNLRMGDLQIHGNDNAVASAFIGNHHLIGSGSVKCLVFILVRKICLTNGHINRVLIFVNGTYSEPNILEGIATTF